MAGWLLFALVILSGLLLFVYPRWRQKQVLAKPFPETWERILRRRLPFLIRLNSSEQQQLRDLIRLFLAEKQFHGCNGQVITDEVRLVIAALACLLLLNRPMDVYPKLGHILVYPDAFVATRDDHHVDGTVSTVNHELLGESWENGKVILSWGDIEADLQAPQSGVNVVWHEFAHQLDGEDGIVNGAPPMRHAKLKTWAEVCTHEFAELQKAEGRELPTVLDIYGASSPAEFFAVATETFFGNPHTLARYHPGLFTVLQEYYKVDPRLWSSALI
jgi:MtfA peptidase